MSRLSDTLKKALEKKKGTHHIDGADTPVVDQKATQPKSLPTMKKPHKRSAGRGR
jgi:hypothetical protein